MATSLSRRDLFAGVGGVLVAPTLLLRQEENRPVGWAVLGLGGYAQGEIMPSFASCKRSKLVGLISGHPDKLSRLGERYNVPERNRYTYDRMEEILHNPEIEVVYVITPPATHREFVERAAKAGKHVTSEKPMAPTVADCQAMIDACRKAGRLLQIGYRSHYENHNIRAIKACRSGELGKLESITSDHGFSIGMGLWRTQKALAGGGSMMDIGIYSLQALRYLSGEEPVEITATITNPPNDPRFVDVEDTVDFKLRLRSGVSAHGTGGYSWIPGKNQYQVNGSKGTLMANPATPYEGHRLTIDGNAVPVESNNQFAAQIDHMSECVRNKGRVLTPGEEGLRDIRIIQAIYASAKTGQPVRL